MSSVSVIVSTNNQTKLLEKVLWGFNCQTFMDFDLIIADAGSGIPAKELIGRLKPRVSFAINHICQEDGNLQENSLLNKAVLASNADYIIITEGDCLPREDFVQVHYLNKEPETFISAVSYILPFNIAKTITLKDIEEQNCFKISWLKDQGIEKTNKPKTQTSGGIFGNTLNTSSSKEYSWNRKNSSGWKTDFLKVNNLYQGIGDENKYEELGERLYNYGIKCKQLRYSAVCIELAHQINSHKPQDTGKGEDKMKFLVIQQKMIGDVLASTLICRAIKHFFPESKVYYIANENTLQVLYNNPHIDQIIVFKQEYSDDKMALYSFLRSIRARSFDVVIDAYGKLESNLTSFFARAKRKIAHYRWYTSWIYTDTLVESDIPQSKNSLANKIRLQLLNPIVTELHDYSVSPKLYLSKEEIVRAKQKVSKLERTPEQKLIMISILGSSALKTYPSEYMAKVVDKICANIEGIVLFNYLPNQIHEARAIYEQCNAVSKSLINFDFYANSLREYILILSQCDALIGNEGGAANMAKALRIPTFCIFSPFIVKEAWHDSSSEQNIAIHLNDYHPELFVNMNKKKIKKVIRSLYAYFKPILFEEELHIFLNKYCKRAVKDNSLDEKY
ncbi:glycosyltransferase family 9 protein [uncultured Eudoraea sp.]|uniref:glycosyltransferase family 9 protein n=1 Tax=uncultured Eudoraea sp. TaxID=1035614 RepID=UPI002628771B|nr:glycosyltransferase family 9 protein [uncultured Eudoraea sp.]